MALEARGDWPQYRGPNRDGVAPGPAVSVSWSPQIAWRRPIGEGFSAIAVVGPVLYTLDAAGGREHVACFDAASGAERWRRDLGPAFTEAFGNGPRSTPAVVDGTVYALGSHGRLVALDSEDGELRWQIELPQAVGGKPPRFGYSPSPLVDGELLVLEVGAGDGRSIAAFNRRSGELVWTAHSDRMGYSSPIAMGQGDERTLVFVTATTMVALTTTGEVRWRWPIAGGSAIDQPIAMPVAVGADAVFVAHRAEGGSALLRLEPAGDGGVRPQVAWENRFMLNHLSSSVHIGGHLYGFHNAILKCVDAATGVQRWARRGLGKGSLIAYGGHLLVLADDGQLVGLRATPDTYTETARLQVLLGRSWTAPSAAKGAVYLRNHREMVRVALVPAAGAPAVARSGESVVARAPGVSSGAEMPAAGAGDLERILAAHLEARGGAERLRQIERLRLRGRYAEASVYGEFELLRQQNRRYRFTHRRGDAVIVRAFDGVRGWWIHPEKSPMPGPMPAGQVSNLIAEAELHGPLVDADARGHRIELIGPTEIDGGEAWELRLTRGTGAVETWFLARDSHLPLERISRLWAYDEEWELHTYFSDYRAVEGLVLPHLIEYEFSSIHRLLRVEQVEINPGLGPGVFELPDRLPESSSDSDVGTYQDHVKTP